MTGTQLSFPGYNPPKKFTPLTMMDKSRIVFTAIKEHCPISWQRIINAKPNKRRIKR